MKQVIRYPVIIQDPTIEQVWENVTRLDCIVVAVTSALIFPVSYFGSWNLPHRGITSTITGTLFTLTASWIMYDKEAGKLQGYYKNDKLLKKYQKEK